MKVGIKVGIVGAGTMGAAIAALFANADYNVVLVDVSEEALKKAKERHRGECLEELEQAGLKKKEDLVSKTKYATNLEELKGCGFVVECIKERLKDKIELLKRVEEIVGEGIIFATNSSSFKPSEMATYLRKPERLTLFHFSNPPILMPLVEVGGEMVAEDVVAKTVEIAKSIGKEPVVLKKECRGHVLNRILGAAGAGVGYCLLYHTPEEIDAAMKNLGSPFGFFETIDLIGLDVVYDVLISYREVYGEKFAGFKVTETIIKKMIEWGKLGKKTGEGFYKWVDGKAIISEAKPADLTPLIAAIVNEAFRIVEDGITDRETVNEVYRLATNSPAGVFDIAEMLGYERILEVLGEIYATTGLEVFKPAESLKLMK